MKSHKNQKANIHTYDSWPPRNEFKEKKPKKSDLPKNSSYIDPIEDIKNTEAPVYDNEDEKKEVNE